MTEKIKEPVKLRRKALKNGNVSLYLSIYVDGQREYQFLKLYLIPESSKEAKMQNKQTLALANSIKAQRIVEIQNGEHGFKSNGKPKVRFFDYFDAQVEMRKKNGTHTTWTGCRRQLHEYEKRNGITFAEITSKWVQGFRDFLCNEAIVQGWMDSKRISQQPLSVNTRQIYFSKLNTVLRQAMVDGIIDRNPMLGVKGLSREESKREYLTIDELRAMASTDCDSPVLKRAFLFSCLTGLRHSDIEKLTWGELKLDGDRARLVFRQKKTGGQEYLDITSQAAGLLGKRGRHEQTETIFKNLPGGTVTAKGLLVWAARAGVNKHITFHSARHTFAVMMLTLGVDLYTVSKLLGHRDIKTTQIYAKIVDAKKQEAVNNIPQIL